jgi:prophage regulatory protein
MSTEQNVSEPLVVSLEVLARLGVDFTNQHLLRMEADGRWPRRLSLGSRKVCWLMSEVKAAIARRAEEREAAAVERSRAAREGVATRQLRQKPAA